jgi:ACT domain-containing protein
MTSKNVTIFGTCRLDSLSSYNTRIKFEISYTYDTKEILEVIKFIKYNHLSPEQTITTFRTPMIDKKPIYSKDFDEIFEKTDIFIIEICGKNTYKYNNVYVHSALSQFSNEIISNNIEINNQTDEEIENDITEIMNELNNNKIIFVGHIVTEYKGERYELSKLLENICAKKNLLFIDPVTEITKKGYNINDLIVHEPKIYHYNDHGHRVMKEIYEEYVDKYT